MSRAGNLVHEACQARQNSPKGARQSHQNTYDIWRPAIRFFQRVIDLPKKIRHIPPAAFMLLVQYELARGIKVTTLKNRSTDFRVISARCGKNLDHFTNDFLGIPNRCLVGKKRRVTDEQYAESLRRADKTHLGFKFILCLQRLFGLRSREACQSAKSLALWLTQLLQGDSTIFVSVGTKGKRSRSVHVLASRRDETIEVVRAALEYCQQFDPPRLINVNGLHKVQNSLKGRYTRAGIRGKFSSHALRYSYAWDRATEEFIAGRTPAETLAAVTSDLGHGAQRLHFTKRTYLYEMADRFVDIPKRRDAKESLPNFRKQSRSVQPAHAPFRKPSASLTERAC